MVVAMTAASTVDLKSFIKAFLHLVPSFDHIRLADNYADAEYDKATPAVDFPAVILAHSTWAHSHG
jgi:hypothetical protein